MSRFLDKASLFSVGLTLTAILFSADGSGASAQNALAVAVNPEPTPMISEPVVQLTPAEEASADDAPAPVLEDEQADDDLSLDELVASQDEAADLSRDMNCLAGAIYFEAKGEPLEGQYAVGRVIIARAESKRFPSTYCGVVYQRSQFSFVRGGTMPRINKDSRSWHRAVAVAQLARADSWDSPVEGAISFHAARVSPRWHLTRMARLGNHIFYR
jgi:cell wall hydrolase